MATGGRSSNVHEEDDRVNEQLLNQVSGWVMYDRLPSLARHLGLSQAEISRIMLGQNSPKDRIFQVLLSWHQRRNLFVRDLMQEMVDWTRGQCLDPTVWDKLVRSRVNPALMPEASALGESPPPSLQLPPPPPPPPQAALPPITINVQLSGWRQNVPESAFLPLPAPIQEVTDLATPYIVEEPEEDVLSATPSGGTLSMPNIKKTVLDQLTNILAAPSQPISQLPLGTVSSSGQLVSTTAAPSGQLPFATSPPSVQLPSTSAPSSDQLPSTTAPPSEQLPSTSAPPGGQISTTTSPPSGQLPFATSPPSVQLPSNSTPSSEQLLAATAPPSGQLPSTSAPSSEQLPATTSPPSEQLPSTSAPSSGQLPNTAPPGTQLQATALPQYKSGFGGARRKTRPKGRRVTKQKPRKFRLGTEVYCPTPEEFAEVQDLTRESLGTVWGKYLSNDWMSQGKAHKFPVDEYYVELKWVKMEAEPLRSRKEKMTNIFELLDVGGSKAKNMLVTADQGMGKTASVAMLAMNWVNQSEKLKKFDLVWTLRLKNVDETSSLAELIIQQHRRLKVKKIPVQTIQAILDGETNHRVLLLLDGYDEYKPGTNAEIDEAIENTVGDCFVLLTSRPGDNYVSKELRDKMNGVVKIEGFSDENIVKCSTQHLGSEQKSAAMLSQAKSIGVYELLKVPIILHMACVIFLGNESLPNSETNIFERMNKLLMDRTTLKTFGCKSSEIPNLEELLYMLGELSWKALQKDSQQFNLEKEDIERKNPDLLKLGLLFEVEEGVATEEEPKTYFSFQHASLQEFWAAKYVQRRLWRVNDVQATLKELFLIWYDVMRLEKTVVFTAGLMSDPTPLVGHVYDLWIGIYLTYIINHENYELIKMDQDKFQKIGKDMYSTKLFISVYKESGLKGDPLHNQWMNWYGEWQDDPIVVQNPIPVHIPSRVYRYKFSKIEDNFDLKITTEESNQTLPDCHIDFASPPQSATQGIISTMRYISCCQKIRNLSLDGMKCKNGIDTSTFNMSEFAETLVIRECELHVDVTRHLLQHGNNLLTLDLSRTTLGANGHILVEHLQSLGLSPPLRKLVLFDCKMPKDVSTELVKSLSKCKNLTHLDLGWNDLGDQGSHLTHTIQLWGPNPPLQNLYLWRCKMPGHVCGELVKSLATCKNMESLFLTDNILGDQGTHLTNTIQSWGPNPALQHLWLGDCKLPEHVSGKIIEALATCKKLIGLDLRSNTLEGFHLAHTIQSWGPTPSLRSLHLEDCKISEDSFGKLFQALATCKNLEGLSMADNSFVNQCSHLVHTIQSWDPNSQLRSLSLMNCKIPGHVCGELVKSLSTCKNLTYLNLIENTLGDQGSHLTQTIQSWGANPPLGILFLRNCKMPEGVCGELVKALSSCNHLSILDLGGNTLGDQGSQLARTIQSWGPNPPLTSLHLQGCKMPEYVCGEVVKAFRSLKQLNFIDLSHNKLGASGRHLVDFIQSPEPNLILSSLRLDYCQIPVDVTASILSAISFCQDCDFLSVPGNSIAGSLRNFTPTPTLFEIDISVCELNNDDIGHLKELEEKGKLTSLKVLWLIRNNLEEMTDQLEKLVKSFVSHHQRELKLYLGYNNLTVEFRSRLESLCEGSPVTLDFERDVDP